jgi:uncharacterized protein (DUF433 family)
MEYFNGIVTLDPEIQFGTPVFTGTRVPVDILFQYLTNKDGLEVFLDQFPTVSKAQATGLLAQLEMAFSKEHIAKLDAAAA